MQKPSQYSKSVKMDFDAHRRFSIRLQDSKPMINVCNSISETRKFSDYYNLMPKCYGRGDFFEIRQISNKHTLETKAAKVFRKVDLIAR